MTKKSGHNQSPILYSNYCVLSSFEICLNWFIKCFFCPLYCLIFVYFGLLSRCDTNKKTASIIVIIGTYYIQLSMDIKIAKPNLVIFILIFIKKLSLIRFYTRFLSVTENLFRSHTGKPFPNINMKSKLKLFS